MIRIVIVHSVIRNNDLVSLTEVTCSCSVRKKDNFDHVLHRRFCDINLILAKKKNKTCSEIRLGKSQNVSSCLQARRVIPYSKFPSLSTAAVQRLTEDGYMRQLPLATGECVMSTASRLE